MLSNKHIFEYNYIILSNTLNISYVPQFMQIEDSLLNNKVASQYIYS